MTADSRQIAYLFSRYPETLATFADSEMIALIAHGQPLTIASVEPPLSSFRHGYARQLEADVLYAPSPAVRAALEHRWLARAAWPGELIESQRGATDGEAAPAARARDAVFFANQLPQLGIRHVHAHYVGEAAHTAFFLQRMCGIPFSLTVHDHDLFSGLPAALIAEVCAAASFIVCISEYTRKLVVERLPQFADKTHIIHKGVDLERFPRSPWREADTLRMLGVGPLNLYKGFGDLIDACAILKRRGLAFRCELVGDGPQAARIREQVASHGLDDQVLLAGTIPQEQVAERLRDCDIFIYPGACDAQGGCDALPAALLEAMAAAKPVISARVGGIPEAVVDNETGLLVESANPDSLARAVFAMLADHDMRRQFGLNARQRVERLFSVHQTAGKLRELIDRHSPPVARPRLPRPRLACLASCWPDARFEKLWDEHAELCIDPDIQLIACEAPPQCELPAFELAEHVQYLDDAMAREADWRHQHREAVRIEALRGELGDRLATESYLLYARRALSLRGVLLGRGDCLHLHALDSEALVVAWILHRLSGLAISASIEKPPRIGQPALAALAPALTHVRVADSASGEQLGGVVSCDPRLGAGGGPRGVIDEIVDRLSLRERARQARGRWASELKHWSGIAP